MHLYSAYATSSYSPSAERSSRSGAYPAAAQNGNTTVQSQPWRGNPYMAPVGGSSAGFRTFLRARSANRINIEHLDMSLFFYDG